VTESANLDLVRSIFADWERGDYESADWADPEIEYVIADGPSPSTRRGIAAMGAAWREVLSAWRDYRANGEEYRELADGRILTLAAFSARGRTSNIEVRQVLARGASVMQIDDGKVTKLVLYFNRDRALADLGLEAQAVSQESTTPDLEELVRRSIAAGNRRDFDALVAMFAPDAVWNTASAGGPIGVFEGREAIRGLLEDWNGAFEEYDAKRDEFRDLGNSVTFHVTLHRARPKGSGGFVEQRIATVLIWHDGLIVRSTTYIDIDKARTAAERLAQERESAMPEESTTPEPPEIMQQGFEALNRRDFDTAAGSLVAPDSVWDFNAWGIGTFKGRPAIRRFLEEWLGSYEEYRAERDETLDLGHGVVFIAYRERARLAGSHAHFESRRGLVALVRDGLVERLTLYTDIDEARAAAERLAQERG
jgi:ketosteroid isomerase-like protein